MLADSSIRMKRQLPYKKSKPPSRRKNKTATRTQCLVSMKIEKSKQSTVTESGKTEGPRLKANLDTKMENRRASNQYSKAVEDADNRTCKTKVQAETNCKRCIQAKWRRKCSKIFQAHKQLARRAVKAHWEPT